MNEIEKLYANAYLHKCTNIGNFCKHIGITCERCKKHKYPLFTAEKQIELVKWLAKNKNDFGLTFYNFEKEPQWESCCEFCWENFNDTCKNIDFEQSLAGLINNLWQSLAEQEQKQIRNILKG